MEVKMTHSAFRTAQIMATINTHTIPTTKTLSYKPLSPLHTPLYRRPLVSCKFRKVLAVSGKPRKVLVVKCSSTAAADEAVDGGSLAVLERCFSAPSSSDSLSVVARKKNRGGKSGGMIGQATLEKSKVEPKPKLKKNPYEPELETGGDGGDIGKKIHHGGGDGGDDDDGDDDYFDDFDDGDEGGEGGLFRRRIVFKELFDRKFLEAVLNEWQRTIMDLPAGLRQACEMGLISTAQLVTFLAINARPTTTRFISRKLPQGISRAFIGRMIADPAFLYKLLLEQAATVGCSTWLELKNRKERIMQEWDLALINVLTAAACNAVVVWSFAPCRSYGNTFRFDLQNKLQKLPNNIFEKSYPLREFNWQKKLLCFLGKATQLGMVGFTAGSVQGALSNLCASKKERLSITIPTVRTNALGYGAFLGVFTNLRYQLLCGLDRTMINYFDGIGVALLFSTALRLVNVQMGETSRLAWLDSISDSNDLRKSYSRPSESPSLSPSDWVIAMKDAVLGGVRIKQGEELPPKVRRKRIVKRKVAS